MSRQRAWTASSSVVSPVSTATSIDPALRNSWRTACPGRRALPGPAPRPASNAPPNRPDPSRPVATSVDVEARELEEALAGHATQLDQRHLDLGMAVDPVGAAGAEGRVDRVGGASGHGQQPVVAERPVPGDRRLDEVADAVQLVAELEVAVLAPGAPGPDGEGVEVAVVALRRGDEVDRLVGHRGDPVVPRPPELPGHALQPLEA